VRGKRKGGKKGEKKGRGRKGQKAEREEGRAKESEEEPICNRCHERLANDGSRKNMGLQLHTQSFLTGQCQGQKSKVIKRIWRQVNGLN